MIENRPWLTAFAHGVLVLGVIAVAFPLYVTFIASDGALADSEVVTITVAEAGNQVAVDAVLIEIEVAGGAAI